MPVGERMTISRFAVLAVLLGSMTGCALDDPATDDTTDDPGVFEVQTTGTLRGVDRAGAFSTREAKRLAHRHAVRWTGVYIGGACNAGYGWSKHRVRVLHDAVGWRFLPIWVGQQTSNICRHHRLTYARGLADGKAAVKRMRAFGWHPHREIPIALDVEGGTYASAHHPSTAYTRGWVKSVRAAGYRAYVYSSELAVEHYHDRHIPLDGVWVASWYYTSFHAADPSQLSLGQRYRHHDRAWQYAGDFTVTGVGRVDGNVSDLLLAPGPGGTNVEPGTSPRTLDAEPLTIDDEAAAFDELALEPADDPGSLDDLGSLDDSGDLDE